VVWNYAGDALLDKAFSPPPVRHELDEENVHVAIRRVVIDTEARVEIHYASEIAGHERIAGYVQSNTFTLVITTSTPGECPPDGVSPREKML
jgi:hypothetical protein